MINKTLILVVNPGSSSRKYALFCGEKKIATVNFEFVDNAVVGKVEYAGDKQVRSFDDADLSGVYHYVLPLLREFAVLGKNDNIHAIAIRLVAPSRLFTQDMLVTDKVEAEVEAIEKRAPLHVKTVQQEIGRLRDNMPQTPIVIVSDSAFHVTKPDKATFYSVDTELAEKMDLRRYGYHGISVGSVVRVLRSKKVLKPRVIICHLGSGSSVSAVKNGKSIENTMGYTPLEGLTMATRTGSIDVSAALMIKRQLNLDDDSLESYLNKNCGLLGISGKSNDIRQLLVLEEQGDARAKLALDIFVYRIQQAIGQMAASLKGVDELVFTATIGERSAPIRARILSGLSYLGFKYNPSTNNRTFEPALPVNIATKLSKPVLVVSTDEAAEIARRADIYLKEHGIISTH